MYAADGNQVTANAVQEYTIPPGEGCSVCGASFRAQDGDLETISLGILYTSFMVSSLFASSVVTKLGSKNALLLGTTGYLPDLLIMFAAKGFDSRLQLNVRELDFRGTLLDFIHRLIVILDM
ncbi:UNC93-like protein 3 [Tanacetum coccineum]